MNRPKDKALQNVGKNGENSQIGHVLVCVRQLTWSLRMARDISLFSRVKYSNKRKHAQNRP